MNAHTHRPSRAYRGFRPTEWTVPYTGPVRQPGERGYDERAHGNVAIVERCSCGARRTTNVNAGRREIGPWTVR